MTDESSFGLSPQRLAKLIAACAGDPRKGRRGEKRTAGDILSEILRQEALLEADAPQSASAVLGRPCDEMLASCGHSIGELILAPKTDLATLKCLKDYGKELVRREGTGPEREALTAVYYAAIASALLSHDRRITELSYNQLDSSFCSLIAKPWIPTELKDLFRRAQDACSRRESGGEDAQ